MGPTTLSVSASASGSALRRFAEPTDSIPFYAWNQATVSPPEASVQPTLLLDVPAHGVVFLNPPEDARVHAQMHGTEPQYDHPLNGELHITLPDGQGPLRVRHVRVGFRAVAKLDLGPGREAEEDVIFQRAVQLGDDPEGKGIVINGSLRFDFTLILPSSLAPRDWHSRGVVLNTLYAKVEGKPLPKSSPRRSPSPPGPSRSSSPRSRSLFSSFSLLSLNRKQDLPPIPKPPEYRDSEESEPPEWIEEREGEEWLQGTHIAQLVIRLVHNPNPTGGVNILDETWSGQIPELGPYDIRVFSDVWSISSLVKSTLILSDLPPATTVYSFRLAMRQTHKIRSPRDGKEIVAMRRFPMIEEGASGELRVATGPSLWRGIAAGGADEGALVLESKERVLIHDSVVRPSTLPGIDTPIHVSHALEITVYFSVYGIDAQGKLQPRGGPGGLRAMRIQRPVVLPTCALVPSTLTLPDYEHPESASLPPDPDQPWKVCACSLSLEAIEQRMKAAETHEEQAVRESIEARNAKAASESRGRAA